MAENAVMLESLIRPSPRFQRAVHLRYDLRDPDAIERYVPTSSATDALESIVRATDPHGTQRAHVLHAAYGSGKSLLAVSLAALLEKRVDLRDSLRSLVAQLEAANPSVGKLARAFLKRDQRFLPVVLTGDEGDLTFALARALGRALKEADLASLQPETRFDSALRTLELWQRDYPSAWDALERQLGAEHTDALKDGLARHLPEAYDAFAAAYTQVAAGATFDPLSYQTPDVLYRSVAEQLVEHGYAGIVVLWDEFGRYLEGRAAQAFSREGELLQAFAEACNHSGTPQLHLLVFAHKELLGYASGLPKTYQQEWSRIEGRFQKHNITGDPLIAYRLIGSAIQHEDESAVQALVADHLAGLMGGVDQFRLFAGLSLDGVHDLIHDTFPLHPLTVFGLARLSARVAQNERTLFTFITTDEAFSMLSLLREHTVGDGDPFVRVHALWDYFADAIRADGGLGGAHRVWSGVSHALDKVASGDYLGAMLIKTLGVLAICGDGNTARPDTPMLAWAVGADDEDGFGAVQATLENLRRRKVIIRRQIDGYWTFTTGSDVDFEARIAEALERTNPTPLQLRRVAEQILPPPYILARRYNQEHAMTRYFTGVYRWPEELVDVDWDLLIQERNNADGLVVYVLAVDGVSLDEAKAALAVHPRVVYVLPDKPLVLLADTLRENFGLLELRDDAALSAQDDLALVEREITYLLEDARARLEREMGALIDPRRGEAIWLTPDGSVLAAHRVVGLGQATRLVSERCEAVFSATPALNSEGLNKRSPTGQQINAAQKVIDAIFAFETPTETLGLEGSGPDVAALQSLLVMTGILRKTDAGEWQFGAPDSGPLALVWQEIAEFLDTCREQKQPATTLIEALAGPPFGLRMGVVPILLAAVMRATVRATTIRQDGRPVHPINGALLTALVEKPGRFSIEIGAWDERLERLWLALKSVFSSHIHESERTQQPLSVLRISMLRWLQGLPSFCRDTNQLSKPALDFRNLIRAAQSDPAKVLFQDLPVLLNLTKRTSQADMETRLRALTDEIAGAYYELQRRLDRGAVQEFSGETLASSGAEALRSWLIQLEADKGTSLERMRFSATITQQVMDVISQAPDDGGFWDKLSVAATGVHLRDWNDQSEEKFRQTLLKTREEVAREAEVLVGEDAVVGITVQLPNKDPKDFRFRASELSAQGRRILQNFKSTLEIAGRPLSADERRQVVVAFLYHAMGEDLDG